MQDRLMDLHQVEPDPNGFSTVELDNMSEPLAAAGSEPDQHLDGVLQEAQQLRVEIQQIQNDIRELKDVNYQTLNKTSYASVTKRDSNTIGSDVKRRGKAVLQRLHMLNQVREELEAERGSSNPAARIARTQFQYLGGALREAMLSYNDTEMSHREACKRQIQRQMEVVGREVSSQELEEIMEEEEELTVFSLQMEGKTARLALQQIQSRHRELQDLEKRIQGIKEVFLDVDLLVAEQGSCIENIQRNVQDADRHIQDGLFKLDRAAASNKNNSFKKLFCGCFPR